MYAVLLSEISMKYDIMSLRINMVYSIFINASLLIISLCAGLGALLRHTDFPRGMTDDEIENYRIIAANYSKTVRGCALTAIILGIVFYILVPALCIIFNVDHIVTCFVAAVLAFVQMATILLVYTNMAGKLNV